MEQQASNYFLKRGAKVIFGDVHVEESEQKLQKLSSSPPKFLRTDATKYSDVVTLFGFALKIWGRVDVAVSNADLIERGNWVDPEFMGEVKSVTTMQDIHTSFKPCWLST